MAIASKEAVQSLRKLRKRMKKVPKRPSPKQVHSLRTQSRRVEAVVHAFRLDRKQAGKRLLKAIGPVRKKAGKVRDMDVLIGFAATLSQQGEEQCLVQLIEHLGSVRLKAVRKLRKMMDAERKEVRLRLKQCLRSIEKQPDSSAGHSDQEREWSADATALALEIWTEMSAWPRLKLSNLHPFRLKVKKLRYVLQLAKNDNGKFVHALGEVKDAIGEWHDWNELAAIETDAFEHGTQCSLQKQIRSVTKAKLDDALSITNKMRDRYQSGNTGRNRILSDQAPI